MPYVQDAVCRLGYNGSIVDDDDMGMNNVVAGPGGTSLLQRLDCTPIIVRIFPGTSLTWGGRVTRALVLIHAPLERLVLLKTDTLDFTELLNFIQA